MMDIDVGVIMLFEIMPQYDIARYIGKDDVCIVDIRDYNKYLKGHIPSAYHLKNLGCTESLLENPGVLGRYRHFIIYCDRGVSSINECTDICDSIYYKRYRPRISSLYGGMAFYRGRLV